MAVNPDRRIKISWAASRLIINVFDGTRIRITASDAELMPNKIFAYQNMPLNPKTGERVAAFDHVCSPPDLEEFPEDAPAPGLMPEWFRLDFVDVLVRSKHEADDFLESVLEDVRSLKATLDIMDTLEPGDSEFIGGAPVEPLSSSSLSSSSESAPSESSNSSLSSSSSA